MLFGVEWVSEGESLILIIQSMFFFFPTLHGGPFKILHFTHTLVIISVV
jgi:hypothetical protein